MRRAARHWVLVAALGLPAAAQCETYAVVPLVGRQLTLVFADRPTANNLDRNQYQYVPVAEPVFDDAVHATVDRLVRARRATDATLIVRVATDAAPEEAATREHVTKIINAVAPKAVDAGAMRLVVVAPYRAAPMLALEQGHVGTGTVGGIGLYSNRFQGGHLADAAAIDRGFLGVFANVRVLVVDARTAAVLAEDVARTGVAYGAAGAKDDNPLNALTSQQKVEQLQDLLAKAIGAILPRLMEKAGP